MADAKFDALSLLEKFYAALGRIGEGMAVARLNMPVGREAYGPMNSIILRMNHFLMFTQTSLADSVRLLLRQFDMSAPPPWDQAIEVMLSVYKSKQEMELCLGECRIGAGSPRQQLQRARVIAVEIEPVHPFCKLLNCCYSAG